MKSNSLFRYSLFLLVTICIIFDCSNRSIIKSDSPVPDNESRKSVMIPKVEGRTCIPEYQLGFGDVIEVKFFDNERFNETVTVRPDGRITLQKIGDIFVTGMTPSQLDSLITVMYSEIIRDPEVTVFVRNFSGYQVYILGEVNSPGIYPLQKNMTVLQSLAAAGGPKNTARLESILILRRSEKEQLNASKIDLTKPLDGTNNATIENLLYIQAQDIIYVPKTYIANVSSFLNQIYEGALPPIDIYLRALWWRK